jgi:hypothetical protein
MSRTAFRFVCSILLFVISTSSLQAQLCGSHRVRLLGETCVNNVHCCPPDACLAVPYEECGCVSSDPCLTTYNKDLELVNKYFRRHSLKSFLEGIARDRHDRCLKGQPPQAIPIEPKPTRAQMCLDELLACLADSNSSKVYCHDKFFSCLREFDALGGAQPCPVEYSAVKHCNQVPCSLATRRCFGLLSRFPRLRCR